MFSVTSISDLYSPQTNGEISESIKHDDDILGCVLSGAGSAVLVVAKQSAVDKAKSKISEVMNNLNVKADIKSLKVENNGATIINA